MSSLRLLNLMINESAMPSSRDSLRWSATKGLNGSTAIDLTGEVEWIAVELVGAVDTVAVRAGQR